MKIKTDFITNSSSASYIIAVKNNFHAGDIKIELLKAKQNLKDYLDEYSQYWTKYDYEDAYDGNIGELMAQETENEKIDFLAGILAQSIYNDAKSGMKIGDFSAYACDGSSEDIDLFSNWLYSFSNINTDNLKIEGFN